MKKRISLIMAVAMMLSSFAATSVGAEETAASSGASIAFGDSARVVDSLEITADNLTTDALAAFNAKDTDGNYLTDPVDLNGWKFQRTIPDGTNKAQAVEANPTWKSKKWLKINHFANVSNNTALPELNSPFSIDYILGTDSNNSYLEFGDFAGGNYYRMNFRVNIKSTEDGTTYYTNYVCVQRYDNGTVAFTKDIPVYKATSSGAPRPFKGTMTYDGINLVLTQEKSSTFLSDEVNVIVNENWENWEMWPARVSGNVRVGTGNCDLYLNKLVVTSLAQNATANDFILNRTFTSADTEAALEAEGWDVAVHSTAISANAIPASKIGYDVDIAGDYTVEVQANKEQNSTFIYLRYDKETKTGYGVESRLSSSQYIGIGKVENGKYVEKERFALSGYYDKKNIKFLASVADKGDNVEVSLQVVESANKKTEVKTWTDEKTEDNTPIKTAGGFLFQTTANSTGTASYAGASYVSSVKVYPTATGSKEISDVDVKYLMNNAEIETIEADGVVYMKMPTAILGQDFSIICALYEDGVMKGVTQVAPIEAYNANGVKLFNTTGLSGEVSVKTFIWSGINQMEALTTPKGL